MASSTLTIYSTNSATFTCSGSSVSVSSYDSTLGCYKGRSYISSGNLTAPSISGYSFAGWYTFPSNSSSIRDDYPTRATTLLTSSSSIAASTVISKAKKASSGDLLCYAKYNAQSGRTVTLAASPSAGGTVSGGGTKYDGEVFTITATASSGYGFMYWEHNGSQVSVSSTYQFTASSSTAGKYTAYFRLIAPTPTSVIRVVCAYKGTFTYASFTVSVNTYDSGLPGYYGRITDSGVNLTAASISGSLFQDWRTFPSNSSSLRDDYISRATSVLSSRNYLTPSQIRSAKLAYNGDYFIYARYAAAVTITYNGNGGTPSKSSETKAVGSSFTLPSATRTGYTFNGWYTASSGGTKVGGSGSSYTPSSSITLYAQWTIVTYTINYNLNGGTAGTKKPTSATYNSWPTVSAPTKTDYTFEGWTVTSGLDTENAQYSVVSGTNVKITSSSIKCGKGYSLCSFRNLRTTPGSVTLTANWAGKTYTVTYNANGGSGVPSKQTVMAGEYLTIPMTMPTKSGATFKGWAKSSTSTTIEFVAGRKYYYSNFTSNPTLYAVWNGDSVLITLDTQGGKLPSGTLPFLTRTIGSTYGTLPTPTPTSSFNGWFTAASGGTKITSSTPITVSSATVLYAQWASSANTYVVNFIDQTGTNANGSQTVTRGSSTRLVWMTSGLGWTIPSGYTIDPNKTWSTVPGGHGTTYANNAQITSDMTTYESIDLYPIWIPLMRTITFNANGGTVSPASMTVPAGSVYGMLPAPTYPGFTFQGWFTDATEGSQITASSVPSGDTTLYAHWTTTGGSQWGYIRYQITLNANGGTVVSSYKKNYIYGYAKALPTQTQVTRSGYTFVGWFENSSFSGSPVTTIAVGAKGDKTYYAKWS